MKLRNYCSAKKCLTGIASFFLMLWFFLQVLLFFHVLLHSVNPHYDELPDAKASLEEISRKIGASVLRMLHHWNTTVLEIVDDSYDMNSKAVPYVGSHYYMTKMSPNSRGWLNSLEVFEQQDSNRLHGFLGIDKDGSALWIPTEMPPPLTSDKVNKTEELRNGGGFYLRLSDSLPLDRDPPDGRDEVCQTLEYDLEKLSSEVDVSIVMTFYNEPLSTLLRSLHSILNFTPPPILREIIIVDDHSNHTSLIPGSFLYKYIQYLPKVKVLRLQERKGIVPARLAGIRLAAAPVITILDSHIEVNKGWLEPQLQRLYDSPKSFVFPQIDSLNYDDFSHNKHSGIGCWLSFDWSVQERATLTGKIEKPDPIKSASHAGGLLSFRKEQFFDIGGYDEEFSFWGAENVEFSFRIWMCGGLLECTPCARVYHVFRKGGTGYSSPSGSIWRNRMRTARIWMGEYYPLAALHNPHHLVQKNATIGNLDKMLAYKKKANCKDFTWFMKEIDPDHEFQDLNASIVGMGDIRSKYLPHLCLDGLNDIETGNHFGLFSCHGQLGNQGFLILRNPYQIRSTITGKDSNVRICLTPPNKMVKCNQKELSAMFVIDEEMGMIKWTGDDEYYDKCMSVNDVPKEEISWKICDNSDVRQRWKWNRFPTNKYLPLEEKIKADNSSLLMKDWKKYIVEIRNKKFERFCVDSLNTKYAGGKFGVFWCHGMLGTQGFAMLKETKQIRCDGEFGKVDMLCLGPPNQLLDCEDPASTAHFAFENTEKIIWEEAGKRQCMTMTERHAKEKSPPYEISFQECDEKDEAQSWVLSSKKKHSFKE